MANTTAKNHDKQAELFQEYQREIDKLRQQIDALEQELEIAREVEMLSGDGLQVKREIEVRSMMFHYGKHEQNEKNNDRLTEWVRLGWEIEVARPQYLGAKEGYVWMILLKRCPEQTESTGMTVNKLVTSSHSFESALSDPTVPLEQVRMAGNAEAIRRGASVFARHHSRMAQAVSPLSSSVTQGDVT